MDCADHSICGDGDSDGDGNRILYRVLNKKKRSGMTFQDALCLVYMW